MAAANKLTVIHDGVGATLSISGYSGTLIVNSFSGGNVTREVIELNNLDATAFTQRLAAKLATMNTLTLTCENQGGAHRSGLAAVTGIRTFTLTSPVAKDGTSKYVLTFAGEITDFGAHEFTQGELSTFDLVITPTGVTAAGAEDIPAYS